MRFGTLTALLITGGLSALAAVPNAIFIGLIFGLLPGLILGMAPTAFFYTVIFAGLQKMLSFLSIRPKNVLAAIGAISIGIALAALFTAADHLAFVLANTGDVSSPNQLKIAGDVELLAGANPISRGITEKNAVPCESLCAALLDTPGVKSVTLVDPENMDKTFQPVTYRLLSKTIAPPNGLSPFEPEQILDHAPPDIEAKTAIQSKDWRMQMAAAKARRNAVIAGWAIRIGKSQTLVAQPALRSFDMTIAISNTPAHGIGNIATEKVEIFDNQHRTLLRRQRVTGRPVIIPLMFWPDGPMMDRGFAVARGFLHTGSQYDAIKPIEILFSATNLARPVAGAQSLSSLRDTLAGTLAAPGHGDNEAMVKSWFGTLDWTNLADADVSLLANIIADPNTKDITGIYDGDRKDVSARLRSAVVRRLLAPDLSDEFRNQLDGLVRDMPPGTFARLSDDELALIRDQKLRLKSSALVERLADSGSENVSLLIQIIGEDAAVEPWAHRWSALADERGALTRLGPKAASALPTVKMLFYATPHSQLTNEWSDAVGWRVAMVRLGEPLGRLTFPTQWSAKEIAEARDEVEKQIERAQRGDVN